MDISFVKIFLTIGAGLASVASPCVLPILPVVVAGRSDDHRLRPLLLAIGLSLTFMIMGGLSAAFGSFFSGHIRSIEIGGAILIFLLGLLTLFNKNIFKGMYWFSNFHIQTNGLWAGLILGMSLGIIWIPCIGPVLSSILAMVAAEATVWKGIFFLFVYSLGFAIPILAIGYFSHLFRTRIKNLQKYEFQIRLFSASILILFALYILFIGSLPQF